MIAYIGPDGLRRRESSGTTSREKALKLLVKRNGQRENNLPIIKNAEKLTFHEAAKLIIDDFVANKRRSLAVVQRRIDKHLTPFFGGRRLVGITKGDVVAYVAKRQGDTIVVRKARTITNADGTKSQVPAVVKPVSNGEINRELQALKRIFNLAVEDGKIAARPKIKMLKESAPRSGFFERDQFESVLAHLPEEIRPVITFAYHTGWRIASEVLPLEWRQIDFDAGEVRLDPGTTKNGEGRVFPMTTDLRAVLEGQRAERDRVKMAGQITPLVFFRMLAEKRGGEKKPTAIVSFNIAWKNACRAAGCPGRIPHDLRRTAIRNLVRNGIPENVAMAMSGHKTRSVFDRYDITSPRDLKDAAQKINAAR
jgi:integrase